MLWEFQRKVPTLGWMEGILGYFQVEVTPKLGWVLKSQYEKENGIDRKFTKKNVQNLQTNQNVKTESMESREP
jgi:hypothetical protein